MKSLAMYAESRISAGKNRYSESNLDQKKSVASERAIKRTKSEVRPAASRHLTGRRTTGRVLSFWHTYAVSTLEEPAEPKNVYNSKLSRLQKVSTRLKAENIIAKTPRPFHRTERVEPSAPDQYTLLLNEYQRLIDLEFAGAVGGETKTKREQIEAELDALETKQALQAELGRAYRLDIDRLTRLIELAREIRTLV